MGTSCAPMVANLYLHAKEKKFMLNSDNANKIKGKVWARFLDDLLIAHADHSMKINYSDIYGESLPITHDPPDPNSGELNFLDVTIYPNEEGRITAQLYDKRNKYGFKINRMPHKGAILSNSVIKGVIIAQLKRFQTNSSDWSNFIQSACSYTKEALSIGHSEAVVSQAIGRFAKTHLDTIKYRVTRKTFKRQNWKLRLL